MIYNLQSWYVILECQPRIDQPWFLSAGITPILRYLNGDDGLVPSSVEIAGFTWLYTIIPSGKRVDNYGKSPKFDGKINYKWTHLEISSQIAVNWMNHTEPPPIKKGFQVPQ